MISGENTLLIYTLGLMAQSRMYTCNWSKGVNLHDHFCCHVFITKDIAHCSWKHDHQTHNQLSPNSQPLIITSWGSIPKCNLLQQSNSWFVVLYNLHVVLYVLFYHSPLQRKVIWKPRQNGRLLYHHAGYLLHQTVDSEWIHRWFMYIYLYPQLIDVIILWREW